MVSFLSETANSIFNKHEIKSLKDLCLILPSKRAVGFMKKELAKCSTTPFLSPKIYAIDDFVKEFSGLKVADNLTLLFELYEVYKKMDERIVFDEFMSWAPTILSDFDLIDQYLVPDPQLLFAYMSEVEALKRWNLSELSDVTSTKSYFDRFETIGKVYEALKKRLLTKNIAYRGMAYRSLAEEFSSFLDENDKFVHFYFVGLNALSKSEQLIISNLVAAKKASCYWDTDEFFMNSEHQAGIIPRKYRRENKFGQWNPPQNLLLTARKNVRVFEAPHESLQAKIGTQLLEKCKSGKTVFVVPDENQVQGVLFSLSQELGDYNISMGIGMRQSKIASLVFDLFDLHTLGKLSNSSFSHNSVSRILRNPLIRSLKEEYLLLIEQFLEHIAVNNIVSIGFQELERKLGKVLASSLFGDWEQIPSAVKSLNSLYTFLSQEISERLDLIEKEFFFSFQTILHKLESEQKQVKDMKLSGLKILLQELFKLEKVAFEGDPYAHIQIMSLLETRCLDFENVIIISFNEGVIPSSNKTASLLPFEACLAFGIPIYHDQDAIMAYHFYRLLMRAKNVNIIYSVSKNGSLGGKSEASRIVNQLRYDLLAKNAGISYSFNAVTFAPASKLEENINTIRITKTPSILAKIQEEISSESRGLSPSSITQYFRCSLQFYFAKILKLQTEDEIEDSFAHNVFGNWIHETLEKIAIEHFGLKKSFKQEDLITAKKKVKQYLQKVFDEKYKGYEKEKGWNHIYWTMAISLLEQFFEQKASRLGEREMGYFAVEEKLTATIQNDVVTKGIRLKGLIDAIEMEGEKVSLVDYKTGKAALADLKPSGLDDELQTFLNAKKDKYRQLLIYLYLFEKNPKKLPVPSSLVAKIYSFRDLDQEIELSLASSDVNRIVEQGLHLIANDMMDANKPFEQTDDLSICQNCEFKGICNR